MANTDYWIQSLGHKLEAVERQIAALVVIVEQLTNRLAVLGSVTPADPEPQGGDD